MLGVPSPIKLFRNVTKLINYTKLTMIMSWKISSPVWYYSHRVTSMVTHVASY